MKFLIVVLALGNLTGCVKVGNCYRAGQGYYSYKIIAKIERERQEVYIIESAGGDKSEIDEIKEPQVNCSVFETDMDYAALSNRIKKIENLEESVK